MLYYPGLSPIAVATVMLQSFLKSDLGQERPAPADATADG
jgi:hypothetical protein